MIDPEHPADDPAVDLAINEALKPEPEAGLTQYEIEVALAEVDFDPATAITDAWLNSAQALREQWPLRSRNHTYASGWSPCERQMVLDATKPQGIKGSPEAIFQRGNDIEAFVMRNLITSARLADIPFTVDRSQERVEVYNSKGEKLIGGKVDAIIEFPAFGTTFVGEIKSGRIANRLNSGKDLVDPTLFASKWLHQLLIYMHRLGHDGLFILDDYCGIKAIEVKMEDHPGKVEDFLEKAELVNDIARGRVDERESRMIEREGVCKWCAHRDVTCFPKMSYAEKGVEEGGHIMDNELSEALCQIVSLGGAAKKYQKARDYMKEKLRNTRGAVVQGESGIFEVSGRPHGPNGWRVNDPVPIEMAQEKQPEKEKEDETES